MDKLGILVYLLVVAILPPETKQQLQSGFCLQKVTVVWLLLCYMASTCDSCLSMSDQGRRHGGDWEGTVPRHSSQRSFI